MEAGTFASSSAFTIPDKGRRVLVPASHGLFQPVNHFLSILRILSTKSPPDKNALYRLCHIQPGPTNRRVERHHPMVKEPTHQLRGEMSCQIIQHQKNA